MAQVRVEDWTGKIVHKKKRGFATKKQALEWETEYMSQATSSLNMTFSDFIQLYFEDMAKRLKATTIANKRFMVELKIIPYFGKRMLNDIKPIDIRKWQNELMEHRDKNGEHYTETYLRTINNQITAIFNYAVKYYGLKENPCHKAGTMGKKAADEMLFWTKDEFRTFIKALHDHPVSYTVFMTLYFTGMREGELLALTPADIDLKHNTIRINKSYQRIGNKDLITSPKTAKSNRTVTMSESLKKCLSDYMDMCYDLKPNDRLFPHTKYFLEHEMRRGCKLSGVKKIRIHDLRHSHAAALVEMNVSPKLLQERLGHERIQTTLDTYGHLYPGKQFELAEQIERFMMS